MKGPFSCNHAVMKSAMQVAAVPAAEVPAVAMQLTKPVLLQDWARQKLQGQRLKLFVCPARPWRSARAPEAALLSVAMEHAC